MPTADPVEALVVVTPQQLDAITALIGPDKVHRGVVGENNIAAFWSDGPKILEQIRNALPDAEQPRLKAWDDLKPDVQATAVGMAAGTLDWAEDGTLHESYVRSVLDNDPELRAALLHPAGQPPAAPRDALPRQDASAPPTRRHDAFISATDHQLAAVTAIVGPENVQRLVMGDNGVQAFYDNGPEILDEIAQVLSETERSRLKTWDELDDGTQHRILTYTAGCEDLDIRYFAILLDDHPEFKAALLNPFGHQPE